MRNVDSILQDRLDTVYQTIDNNANPATWLRIQRRDIPLHEKIFIEKSRIVNRPGLTDSDIAVCHPRFGHENTEMWVAYVRSGTLHVKWANNHDVMTRSEWNDYHFTTDAEACAIGFYSTAKHNARGIWDFVTEEEPWVFWVHDGSLKAKKCTPLGDNIIELAEENVTDVSVVRAPSGEQGNWNLGLAVFFLMNGSIYYRQLIEDTWYDAELVQFSGLGDLTISAIKAFNTWDYRVGVQILASDGKLYELYSYTEGIGTRGTEHLSLSVVPVITLIRIGDLEGFEHEHIELGMGMESDLIYGLSAVPVSIANVQSGGSWSKVIEVTMDIPNTGGQASEFELTDSDGNYYRCENLEIVDNVLRLTFFDFSNAEGKTLTLKYTQGTLMSYVPLTDSFTLTFTPTNIHASGFPTVVSIYNM